MSSKFAIDYHLFPEHRGRMRTQNCSNQSETRSFLEHLISTSSRIVAIRQGCRTLCGIELDKVIKAAAESMVGKMLENSLGVAEVEIKERFGFEVHVTEIP